MSYDRIVSPWDRFAPWFAKPARGPGGVISDADGRVLANVLQQDLDRPPDYAWSALPMWAAAGRAAKD